MGDRPPGDPGSECLLHTPGNFVVRQRSVDFAFRHQRLFIFYHAFHKMAIDLSRIGTKVLKSPNLAVGKQHVKVPKNPGQTAGVETVPELGFGGEPVGKLGLGNRPKTNGISTEKIVDLIAKKIFDQAMAHPVAGVDESEPSDDPPKVFVATPVLQKFSHCRIVESVFASTRGPVIEKEREGLVGENLPYNREVPRGQPNDLCPFHLPDFKKPGQTFKPRIGVESLYVSVEPFEREVQKTGKQDFPEEGWIESFSGSGIHRWLNSLSERIGRKN
ncbi:MAG: hypothetical protein D084_Lepto4C00541G0001 [Leptospirillum sp. Group IV 'UBA BS']|nr:MAG: hypothetical protein D084_Lepto4C00541G0001 [Leptospirillum sp. Group IV 'UBA BS']